MKHYYKLPLRYSDLFISDFDLKANVIAYEVRDKITEKQIESSHVSTIEFFDGQYHFDNRFVDLQKATEIYKLLNL